MLPKSMLSTACRTYPPQPTALDPTVPDRAPATVDPTGGTATSLPPSLPVAPAAVTGWLHASQQPHLLASDPQETLVLNNPLTRSQRKNQKRREKKAAREAVGPYGNWKAQRARRLVAKSFSFAAAFPVPRFLASKEDGLTGVPRKTQPGDSKAYTVEELQAEGFEVVPWDGTFILSIDFVFYN